MFPGLHFLCEITRYMCTMCVLVCLCLFIMVLILVGTLKFELIFESYITSYLVLGGINLRLSNHLFVGQ